MSMEQGSRLPGGYGPLELDELQRSQEQPLTVETLEGLVPATHGESREMPVPEPGERPGAIPPEAIQGHPPEREPEPEPKKETG